MATARLRELGQLSPEHTILMVCDLQEKFAPSIERFWAIVNNAERLIKVGQRSGNFERGKGCVTLTRDGKQ